MEPVLKTIRQFQLSIDSVEAYISLFGLNDQNLKIIEQECSVTLNLQGNALRISGEEQDIQLAFQTVQMLLQMIEKQQSIDRLRIRYTIAMIREGKSEDLDELEQNVVAVTHRGKKIQCRTLGQTRYVESVKRNDIVFAFGPAGTGKTYLAMALAVTALKNKDVERIILTRPAVEAGEKLGFLPGDLAQKVDPYLRPLYDAMYDFIGPEACARLLERGTVEVAPLAYMRGRTLSDAFIILDEAQNTTSEQMKMFLTRMGFRSKVIITGDITQTDLPPGRQSGLVEAVGLLGNINGIGIVQLSGRDIVRHELVQKIVESYESGKKTD